MMLRAIKIRENRGRTQCSITPRSFIFFTRIYQPKPDFRGAFFYIFLVLFLIWKCGILVKVSNIIFDKGGFHAFKFSGNYQNLRYFLLLAFARNIGNLTVSSSVSMGSVQVV